MARWGSSDQAKAMYFKQAKDVSTEVSDIALGAMISVLSGSEDEAEKLSMALGVLGIMLNRYGELAPRRLLSQAAAILVSEVMSWSRKPYLVIKVDAIHESREVFMVYGRGSFEGMCHLESLNNMVLVSLGGPSSFLDLFSGVLLIERVRRGVRLVEHGIGVNNQVWVGLTPEGDDIYVEDEKDRKNAELEMLKTWLARYL